MKWLLTILAIALLAAAPAAAADGLPLTVDATPVGVVNASGEVRYITSRASRGTAVTAVRTDGGQPSNAGFIRGNFTVPAVAYDGSASGLSADGRTLVLINPRRRFPRRRTTFAVLRARSLRLLQVVRLRGDFSFDALSPDGRSLFLINYLSPRDPTSYRVRVYDLDTGRLAPKPIVDPREDPDEMSGQPITRATSPDGRWAYTLYDGREHPFIHALDTVDRKAVCIDLATPPRGNPYSFRLDVSPGGGQLRVLNGKRGPLALVDTRSFKVTQPPVEATDERGGMPWAALGGLTALLAAGALGVLRRRRRRHAPEADWPHELSPNGTSDDREAAPEREPAGRL